MAEQFPNDEIDGKPRVIVHFIIATVDPHESPALAERFTDLTRNVGAGLDGFVEGRVFDADDGKSVIVMTSWKTRHAWAQAEWDQQVGDFLAQSLQSGVQLVGTICYERATIAPP